ncbi:MAG: VOC family protein [Rhodopila sp.]|nr:VOC family protein [Rhodopila sp.]
MQVQALGYLGFGSADLDGWSGFATSLLGMQAVERGNTSRAFRMDDRAQRLIIDRDLAEGSRYIGWEVVDEAALAELAARLDRAGVAVAREPAALADRRAVAGLISFADPLGNRLEVFHGAAMADAPFVSGRAISGFRTGPLGMGHVVITVERLDAALPFYRDVLGFGVSDIMERPFGAAFFHVNPRQHSFAMLETGRNGMHHFMVELCSLDDIGQGYDLALGDGTDKDPSRVMATLGRHTNDWMTSFYLRSPAGFQIEYGWGGRVIDPANWTPQRLEAGPSLWGHERTWLPPEARAEARAMRLQAGAAGLRQPLQVLEDSYSLTPGVCAWWDQARSAGQPRY